MNSELVKQLGPLAEAGSDTYGICSNRFLDKKFKTERYELTVTVLDQNRFRTRKTPNSSCPDGLICFATPTRTPSCA